MSAPCGRAGSYQNKSVSKKRFYVTHLGMLTRRKFDHGKSRKKAMNKKYKEGGSFVHFLLTIMAEQVLYSQPLKLVNFSVCTLKGGVQLTNIPNEGTGGFLCTIPHSLYDRKTWHWMPTPLCMVKKLQSFTIARIDLKAGQKAGAPIKT